MEGAKPRPTGLKAGDSCVYRKEGFYNQDTCSNNRCELKSWVDWKSKTDSGLEPDTTCPLPTGTFSFPARFSAWFSLRHNLTFIVSNIDFKLVMGSDCGGGKNLDCEMYSTRAEIEAACAKDPLCQAYSMKGGKAWCRKAEFKPNAKSEYADEGHNCFYKTTMGKYGSVDTTAST
jgi:hypothetical protein